MSTVVLPATQTYAIDPAHTTAEFVVRHMMISKVRGRFAALNGSLEVPASSNVPTAVKATVDTSSVDTREPQRDAHLRSADFFDVDRFPDITFVSSQIRGSEGSFEIDGTLTIHGVSREVTLAADFQGRATDPWGNRRIGYEAHTTINRKDFGLGWNQALETGGLLVGDEVRIELNVEAIAQG